VNVLPTAASGALIVFDNEAAFVGAAPIVSTESFDEFPSDTFLGIVTAVVDGITYEAIGPDLNAPPPFGWLIEANIFGPVSPPNEFLYTQISPSRSLSFGDGMIAHAIGFYLVMPIGIPPGEAELTVTLGDDTQILVHASGHLNYRGFVAAEGIKSIAINTDTPFGASNNSFDNVSRSAIVPAIPEPATWVLVIAATSLLTLRRR
jgi:hypothetical protein